MLGFLLFVLGVLVVGGLLFLGASLLLGRGETQPPAELDRSPVELPDDRPVTSDDVRALRISAAIRGYRMSEVDWLLDQFALILDERDAEIARLRQKADLPPVPHPPPHPFPRPAHPVDDAAPKTLDGPAVPVAEPEPHPHPHPHHEERPHA
ncbi:MAG: cell division initiation protein DivIVA [Blastococcus sp.]|jgi:DivIVA domain-containing protein|nr:cell division initiation protein DivIVA [Blastococcus sp.]